MAKEYDPYMHTAEHVLNQTMVRTFGCDRCFSSHLNAKKSKCDYEFARPLTDGEALQLENDINAVLAQCLPVREEFVSYEEAKAIVNVSRLPQDTDITKPIRLIRVGDYDVCPCIGEHVSNTQEVGKFVLKSHSYLSPEESEVGHGVLRLRFGLQK